MFFPPSLPQEVLTRSFRAGNGERGLLPQDADAFLSACEQDGVTLLGWELWLIDHLPDFISNEPEPAPGRWSGLIPIGGNRTAVFHGSGDREQIQAELAEWKWEEEIAAKWLPFIRYNFTIAD